jgi:hypothetical protein
LSQQTIPSGKSDIIYENKNYKLVVGVPPGTSEIPNPIPCYLIVNKETNVTESWGGILFYTKQTADQFNDLLETPPAELKDAQQEKGSFFN